MQLWTRFILVLAWKMVTVVAQCPSEFTSGMTLYYLIYPGSNGWKYQEPNGETWNSNDTEVYPSPNCYKYIPMKGAMQSCIDTQRECEKLGGNTAMIESIEEYEHLTGALHHIILTSAQLDIKFKVFNQEVGINVSNGCATITIMKYGARFNAIMENTDCSATSQVDAIICESSGVDTAKNCPVERIPSEKNESTVSVIGPIVATCFISTLLSVFIFLIILRRIHLGTWIPIVCHQVAAEGVRKTVLNTKPTAEQKYDSKSSNDNIEHDSALEVAYNGTATAKEVV